MNNKGHSGYLETLQHLFDDYVEESGKEAVTTKEVAVWAVSTHRWDPPHDLILSKCQEDFARALREQYVTNIPGRPVRAKHVARIIRGEEQLHLWADIRRAPRVHMEIAFQQRREQIVGDCRQLKRDVDYYNAAHPRSTPIQLIFDFRDDIEEGDFPGEYPKKRPA